MKMQLVKLTKRELELIDVFIDDELETRYCKNEEYRKEVLRLKKKIKQTGLVKWNKMSLPSKPDDKPRRNEQCE